MADKKMTHLSEPEAAIASYLDELLSTATRTALREEPPVPSLPEGEPAPEPEAVQEPEPEPEPEPGQSSARPDWSEHPFECLIFRVAGLQLAVPLVLLGAIHRIEEPVKPIPGSPRWYMGMRATSQHTLRVVDTAEWIMAGRVPPGARDNYRFIIRLDDSEWGLACDEVAESFTLQPDQVRWRSSRSKRPWLAGTVISEMCALIDVRTMADLLARAEREHHLALE
ncbi:chemotaxis protein CheW [Marinobacter sp.]|uniref:chemotaxis protein CheW n=1 Tax=Marinobacter sp. TaxID=50741 RepID=UPI0019CC9D9E|nr:chemotaxis protein CheW [Marinobacter sp.]MBC7191882.1 chemotaxis protein CheW [Marinobacter sp.]